MKKYALPAIVGVLAFVAVGVAKADPMVGSQSAEVVQPWTIEAGGAWSTDHHSPWYGNLGLDYGFEKSKDANPVVPSIYLDDIFTTSGSSGNITDLGVAIRQDYRDSSSIVTPYVGVGVSGYYVSTSGADHSGLGAKAFGGVEFDSGWVLEANYSAREQWDGANLSTYGVDLGFRF
jgi:hypothetical protein